MQAKSKTAWEYVPAGLWWENGLIESRAKALKVTLKYVLSRTLRREEPALSYIDLCKLLTMAANAVNEQPVALWSQVDDFTLLTANRMPIGRMPKAAGEHLNDPEEQYVGASKHQRNLFNMWWKQQGFASLHP